MSLALAVLAAAALSGYADLDAVDAAVAEFADGAASPVDRRLRLQPCAGRLALSWRTEVHDSVVVQCGDVRGWRLFVPVRADARPRAAPVINRGDAVSIAITGDGFAISQLGAALDSGAVDAWIRVRPVASRRGDEPMRAQVVRPGLVALPAP